MNEVEQNFKKYLKSGQEAEEVWANYIKGSTYEMGKDGDIIDPNLDIHEIKREQNYLKTGNFFIETSFKGEPSGINGTKARFWVHCYLAPDGYWYFYKKKVKLLKLWLHFHQHDIKFITNCGDDNNSTGYLIKKEIFPIMNWNIYKVINKTKNKK